MSIVLIRNVCSVLHLNNCYSKLIRLSLALPNNLHKCSALTNSAPAWGSKKQHRNVKLNFDLSIMADPEIEKILAPLREKVKEQGDLVRSLKASGAAELDVKKAVAELKTRKKTLEDKELALAPADAFFDRAKMEDLCKRRFFYDQSFSIYGGITGQFDYGPMGCALKTNMLNLWRNFFVLEEQMLEVDCSILTPEPVLKASGHVDRFADLMAKDMKTGECFRLDHLIKSSLEKISQDKKTSQSEKDEIADTIVKLDGMTKDEMNDILIKYKIKSPLTGNDLSEPVEFNLMFSTQIGPAGTVKGYLRPETAQGMFVNFKRLLDFNQSRLPFAAAQIGNAFRNEISPRSGLIRVREFTLAEIEHFCDPNEKNHPKFDLVENTEMRLYSACNQMDGKPAQNMTIGEGVKSKLVANESLGYFMARIQLYLLQVGIDKKRLRFRQHMSNEMAHYACDCWDAECLTSYGWVECVGCADRSAYDLTQHTQATNVKLVAEKKLAEPKTITVTEVQPNKSVIGRQFKKDAKLITDVLASYSEKEISDLKVELEKNGKCIVKADGREFKLAAEMLSINTLTKTIHVEEIVPNVIEPAFGIGRIMYALLEHSFRMREGDEQRTYFSLPPIVAPLKCCVLPLSNNAEFRPLIRQLSLELSKQNISHKVDDSSGSIGRRYARTDEVATPFSVTIDFDSLNVPHTASLRHRDTLLQLRLPVSNIPEAICDLASQKRTWEDLEKIYPKFEQQEATKAAS